MEKSSTVMAIYQGKRSESAVQVQDVLTKYGCSIHVRLGLHDAGPDFCSNAALCCYNCPAIVRWRKK